MAPRRIVLSSPPMNRKRTCSLRLASDWAAAQSTYQRVIACCAVHSSARSACRTRLRAIKAGRCGEADTLRQPIGGLVPQCGNCHIETATAGLDPDLANEGGPSCAEIVY